jgi:hypothetical protein
VCTCVHAAACWGGSVRWVGYSRQASERKSRPHHNQLQLHTQNTSHASKYDQKHTYINPLPATESRLTFSSRSGAPRRVVVAAMRGGEW